MHVGSGDVPKAPMDARFVKILMFLAIFAAAAAAAVAADTKSDRKLRHYGAIQGHLGAQLATSFAYPADT